MNNSDKHAVGIDLGTAFSVVAYLDASGKPRTIPNSEGELLTPSAVFFEENGTRIVGKEAVKAGVLEPDRLAVFAKRDMGLDAYVNPINGQHWPPEVIQSFVLEKLKRDAIEKIGAFHGAVITVPAFFNEPRRKATQDAAQLAGIKVLDIINEPTAAAIDFGFEQGFLDIKGGTQKPETILVYDLGGGTFDVTAMTIEGTTFTAIATAGDVYLGGIDWDRRLAEFLADEYKGKYCIDLKTIPTAFQKVIRAAEDAKHALSAREKTIIVVEHAGQVLKMPFSRKDFESLTSDLLERTRLTTHNLLHDANLTWSKVNRLLLVGGSTRMLMIQKMLEQESGKKVDRTLSADEAVAHGAAIYAGLMQNGGRIGENAITIKNVNSHNLGVLGIEHKTGRPRNRIMIPRNTALPAKKSALFMTYRENQGNVAIRVVEGGDVTGQNCTLIGTLVVRDLPAKLPAKWPVTVVFEYAQNGRLTVKARLPNVDRGATFTLERASGLTEPALLDWSNRIRQFSSRDSS